MAHKLPHILVIQVISHRVLPLTLLIYVLEVIQFRIHFDFLRLSLFLLRVICPSIVARKYQIQGQLEKVVNHPRYQHLQVRCRLINPWVCVNLDQPRLEVLVQNQIVPQQLEAVFSIIPVKHFLAGINRRVDDFLYPRQDFFQEI